MREPLPGDSFHQRSRSACERVQESGAENAVFPIALASTNSVAASLQIRDPVVDLHTSDASSALTIFAISLIDIGQNASREASQPPDEHQGAKMAFSTGSSEFKSPTREHRDHKNSAKASVFRMYTKHVSFSHAPEIFAIRSRNIAFRFAEFATQTCFGQLDALPISSSQFTDYSDYFSTSLSLKSDCHSM